MAEEELELDDAQELGEDELEEAPALEPDLGAAPKTKSNLQLFIIGGVAFLLVVGGLLFYFSGSDTNKNKNSTNEAIMIDKNKEKEKKKKKKVKYFTLFTGLPISDTSKILKELSIHNITFQTLQTGSKYDIQVDEDQVDEARNLLAIKGLPEGSATGYELLDNTQTLGVTEFDKRVRFLRAVSGELQKAINQLNIVESSKVQIVLPEQRLFTVTQPPVTAAILIRVKPGHVITDEIVFSIIQLVSNGVENLQPENVSVINTEGTLLSDGIFERMAARKAGTYIDEDTPAPIEAAISREEAIGRPIIPNYSRIQEWFDIKWNYEKELREKTERQLYGILPIGAFKVEVTSDIGPLENGNIVDIKRLTISVVIDGMNDDIFVDKAFKQQVFATVAGAVGYLRGRDTIQLSVAEFPLYTEEEKKELRRKYAKKGILSYAISVILGFGFIAFVAWVFNQFILRLKQRKKEKELLTINNEDTDFDDLDEVVDVQPLIDQVKQWAETNPEYLAEIMEKWIKPEMSEPPAEDTGEAPEDEANETIDSENTTEEEVAI